MQALPGRIVRRIARDLTKPPRRWLDGRGPTTLPDRAFDALIAPARERGMDPLDWSHRLVDAAALREALGSGTLWGYAWVPASLPVQYVPASILIQAPGAYLFSQAGDSAGVIPHI